MILGHTRFRTAARLAVIATVAGMTAIAASTPAFATITLSTDAAEIAGKVMPVGLDGASWANFPPGSQADGFIDEPLGGFPTEGDSFGILTTGDAGIAANSNDSTGSGQDNGGNNLRGNSDWDVSILKINFTVPQGMDCFHFDFRFFTEEYPEYAGQNNTFNDAFVAELDTSDWTTNNSVVSAPNNFAFDQSNNAITVNSTFAGPDFGVPADTTYDGATPILTAAKSVAAGSSHSLYLSIFDQGNDPDAGARLVDSAVFFDNLRFTKSSEAAPCDSGAEVKQDEATTTTKTQTATPTTTTPGDLPATGDRTGLLAGVGGGLLVLGVAAFVLARRRRNATDTTE